MDEKRLPLTELFDAIMAMRDADRQLLAIRFIGNQTLTQFDNRLLEGLYQLQVIEPLKLRSGNGCDPVPQLALQKKLLQTQKSTLSQAIQRLSKKFIQKNKQGRESFLTLTLLGEGLLYGWHEIDRLLIPKLLSTIIDARERDDQASSALMFISHHLSEAVGRSLKLNSQKFADIVETQSPASISRVYYALAGGVGMTFGSDRAKAELLMQTSPALAECAQSHRSFMRRTIVYLAQRGFRQFIDLGSAFPCNGAIAEILQRVLPPGAAFKVLYTDIDHHVVETGHLILDEQDDRVRMVRADATRAQAILTDARKFGIDLSTNVAIIATAVFHFEKKLDRICSAIQTLRASISNGSALVISHSVAGTHSPATCDIYRRLVAPAFPRKREEIMQMFSGFILEPADVAGRQRELVPASQWRPDIDDPFQFGRKPGSAPTLAGVGIKE